MGSRHLLLLLSLCVAAPATAGTLYRCVGADGVPNYTSKRASGAVCSVVAQTAYTPPARTSPVLIPAASSGPSATTPATTATTATAPVAAAKKGPRFLGMGASTTYSFVDASGVRNFSSRRPKGIANLTVTRTEFPIFAMETCYACAVAPNINFNTLRLNTTAYGAEISAAASQYGVEEAVVRAIIHAESAYRANARSAKNAQGLMQLIPSTAARFGVTDAYDPAQNISGGVQYLAWLMKRYSSNLTLVAAAYNAGEGAVDRNGGVPPYAETQRYVARVGQLADRYRSALATR